MIFDQLRFEKLLEAVSETKIQDISFDILNNKIVIIVEPFKKEPVAIVFDKVSAYYFVNDDGEDRLKIRNPDQRDFTELTSISYLKGGVGKIAINSPFSWTEQWYSSANFFMELWTAALFVEAKTITIDGETFDIGYPNIEGND